MKKVLNNQVDHQTGSNIYIQPQMEVGKVDDEYEKEANDVADKIMRMPESDQMLKMRTDSESVQMMKMDEDYPAKIQTMSEGNKGGMAAPQNVEQGINNSKGSGQSLPATTQADLGTKMNADLSNVKIHTDSNSVQMNKEIGAKAFTHGNDIYFNQGQYNPQSSQGKHLLAHELTHTVQQGNKIQNNTIQRYFETSIAGNPYRISNDLTTAVKVGYPNHDLYAESGKAKASNILLAAVGSGIELVEENSTFTATQGSNKKTLKKVIPKNKQNNTSGNAMEIWADCGKSCAVVVGSSERSALHHDALTGTDSKTMATTPSLMKAEIMKKMLDKWLTMPSTPEQQKTEINDVIAKANSKQLEINAAIAAYNAAATDAERTIKGKIYWTKVDEYGNIMMEFYNKMPESKREEIDKSLKINKFANPSVGQGFTMSSGGSNYQGKNTWNFHWGGVVMKSNDQQDTITLENYAVGRDVENDSWDFAMYGTAAKKGQTFHEQHHDTKQHGNRPTTMTIEKK